MKSIIKCILSFFILFSSVDLSMITLFNNIDFSSTKAITVSEVVKVQYDLIQKTKNVVANICNDIAKDVTNLLASYTNREMFFDKLEANTRLYMDNYFNYVKMILLTAISSSNFITKNINKMLFFFGFIFLFMLSYLGLLFTFGKTVISQQYRKAYSI